ncbi:hypothetical protein FACS1894152_8080 [Bacilli bacterium]|nr:hypothetical protein FACS1894152_8080 [Bacilli bacterium]
MNKKVFFILMMAVAMGCGSASCQADEVNLIQRILQIIYDNPKTAFLNLTNSASRNVTGKFWFEGNYDRINRDKQDAANVIGFSSGARLLGDGNSSALHLLFGLHIFPNQGLFETEKIILGAGVVEKYNVVEAKVISAGLYGRNVMPAGLYVDYALYLGYYGFKMKTDISVFGSVLGSKPGSEHGSVDGGESSALNFGGRLGLGYSTKLSNSVALDPNVHFNAIEVKEPAKELGTKHFVNLVQLVPGVDLRIKLSNKMRMGMFFRYNISIDNIPLNKDNFEFGASLSSNGSKGIKISASYKIAKKDNNELNFRVGYRR